jgi:glycine/D-amino acid oxidase-like deaminating enzyme
MHVAVVGGGVIGLLSAVECVLAGHQVTLVEQDQLPSPRATSSDRHRILRALHPGDPQSTAAVRRAHSRWIELEWLLGDRFYLRVGSLTVLPQGDLADAVSLLWTAGVPGRVLHPAELKARYPHLGLPDRVSAVLEDSAGVLLADRVLAACVHWLRSRPGVFLWSRRAATRIDVSTPGVHFADGDVLDADAVIVAAGPWSRKLLPDRSAAELTLLRQSMVYCRVPETAAARWSTTPAVPALGTAQGAWLVPPVAGSPLKLSAASACRVVDQVTDHDTSEGWRHRLTKLFTGLLPGFTADWVTDARDCYYLERTGSGGRAVVRLGRRAVAFAACGGGAFKLAPLIARSLVGQVCDPNPVGLRRPHLQERGPL